MDFESNYVADLLKSSVKLPDYISHLGRAGRRMKDSKLITLFEKQIGLKKNIMLCNGVPNNDSLPVNDFQFSLRDGSVFRLDELDMAEANNYGQSEGLKSLRQWLLGLQKLENKPPQIIREDHPEPFDLAITNGNVESINICFQILLDEGDFILHEQEIYSTTLSLIQLYGVNSVPVKSDEQGMDADHMEYVLENWSEQHPGLKRPKLIYAITSCSNPTGNTWTARAMARVYEVCRKYDIIIIEDAAYYFLQFGQRQFGLQSIDVDGRVIRLDSFSKIIGPGYRIGWISGPKSLLERFNMCVKQSTIHPCIISQLMINRILQSWGYETFHSEMKKISEFYHRRALDMATALEKYMKDLATWRFPSGGMFFWIKIKDLEDSSELITAAFESGIIFASGDFFMPQFQPSEFIRLSFTLADKWDLDEGIKILANVIKRFKRKLSFPNLML